MLVQACSNSLSIGLTCSGSKSQVVLQLNGPFVPFLVGQMPWTVHESAFLGKTQWCFGLLCVQTLHMELGHCWVNIKKSHSLSAIVLLWPRYWWAKSKLQKSRSHIGWILSYFYFVFNLIKKITHHKYNTSTEISLDIFV